MLKYQGGTWTSTERNIMEILRIILFVVLGVATIGLWSLAISGVNDKILDLQIRIRKEKNPTPGELRRQRRVHPLVVTLVQNRLAIAFALVLAPLLVVGYGLGIIAILLFYLLPIEAYEALRDAWSSVSKRVSRQ